MPKSPHLPRFRLGPLEAAFEEGARRWQQADGTRRLFDADASLFTGSGEDRWLGWLTATDASRPHLDEWNRLAAEVAAEGMVDVVVLGMGGSSLCPDVLARTFGPRPGHPQLHVLDSTVPGQIRALEERIDPARTLFVVPSKSGSTLEPEVLKRHFLAATADAVGDAACGAHFVAITDPGSDLEAAAAREGFRHVALGVPSIGGRFSALSVFGMLPAALLGLDAADLLDRADAMRERCRLGPEIDANPAVGLGIALGEAARQGRDKLTLILSPEIEALGSWLEQLVAESTGKSGRGILPVDGEPLAPPSAYGNDRLFVQIRLESETDRAPDTAMLALEEAGHPVIRIDVPEKADLAAEFFRFEVATAVAGAVLGVNPFDQPDVEDAKVAARGRMAGFEAEGRLPATAPILEDAGVRLHADPGLAIAEGDGLAGALAAHFSRLRPGDYLAVNAFLAMDDAHASALQRLRTAVRDACGVATTVGFGPRFLHSTGQLHKGGPASGVFVQLTADDPVEIAIPGLPFDFGILKQAQAEGDFQILCERGRRAIRIHLAQDRRENLEDFVGVALRALGDSNLESRREAE